MIDKIGVLHLVHRIGLFLPKSIQLLFGDISHHISLNPAEWLIFWHKTDPFIWLVCLYQLLKILLIHLNLYFNFSEV